MYSDYFSFIYTHFIFWLQQFNFCLQIFSPTREFFHKPFVFKHWWKFFSLCWLNKFWYFNLKRIFFFLYEEEGGTTVSFFTFGDIFYCDFFSLRNMCFFVKEIENYRNIWIKLSDHVRYFEYSQKWKVSSIKRPWLIFSVSGTVREKN